MYLTIDMDLDNDAMHIEGDPDPDALAVAERLRTTADKIERHATLQLGDAGAIIDTNGNSLGSWIVVETL